MAAGGRRRTSADLFGPLCGEILLFKGAVSQRIKHSSNKEKLRLTKKTAPGSPSLVGPDWATRIHFGLLFDLKLILF